MKNKNTYNSISSIPWFGPEVGEREKELVLKVLDSNYINDGEITREFETRIAKLVGVKYCVGVSSGTVAIALALMGLGIGCGDEVIVPDLTFIGTASAVKLAGAKVKLVDVDPARFAIDIEKLKKSIGPSTRAIISVDVNGRGADYEKLESLAKEKGLFLICDAAEALGSKWKGRYLGTFGQAGCFSFSANKTVTTGQGGMIATNDEELYYRLRELKDQGRRYQGTGGDDLHPVVGFNFKLTNLQSAVGLAQLERFSKRLEKAQERDDWYRELLGDCPGIILPLIDKEGGEILQWADALIEKREKVREALDQANIGYRAFWHPLHRQLSYKGEDKYFSTTISISEKGLWLPSHFNLTREEAERTAKVIRETI